MTDRHHYKQTMFDCDHRLAYLWHLGTLLGICNHVETDLVILLLQKLHETDPSMMEQTRVDLHAMSVQSDMDRHSSYNVKSPKWLYFQYLNKPTTLDQIGDTKHRK